jgi:spoIIIJ-associated protein
MTTDPTQNERRRRRRPRRLPGEDLDPEPEPELELAAEATPEPPQAAREAREARAQTPPTPAGDGAEDTRAWLQQALALLGQRVQVNTTSDGEALTFDVSGQDAERVLDGLGQGRGQLLQALQTLAQARLQGENERRPVAVDVHGLRQRKVQALTDMASFLAEKVVNARKPLFILGMSSFERRAIHGALSERRGVQTESEGQGSLRRLKISPR